MKLSALTQKEREIQVRVGDADGDVVRVVYAPGRLTLEVADLIRAATEKSGAGGEMYAILSVIEPILVSWDLEADDGTPLGIDEAAIKKVPVSFLSMLMTAITEDSKPGPTKDETSADGSAPAEVSEGAQSGTPSSPLQGSLV